MNLKNITGKPGDKTDGEDGFKSLERPDISAAMAELRQRDADRKQFEQENDPPVVRSCWC